MHAKFKYYGILILFSILLAVFFVQVPLSPPYNAALTTTNIQFYAFGASKTIFIDDTPSFTSPFIFEEGREIILSPGAYYWKADGVSLVSRFTILSTVALDVHPTTGGQRITNVGNVPARVSAPSSEALTGSFILEPEENLDLPLTSTTIRGEESYGP